MKKSIVFFSFISLLIACSDDASKEARAKEAAAQPEAQAAAAEDPEVTKGLELIAKSDCLTCHKVSEAAVGPAYEAVAAKYPATDQTYDSLASKIINGGAGNWGQVPMTPHPNISKEDARAMARYVMSLKK